MQYLKNIGFKKGCESMIYTIEKRNVCGYGTISTHYEVRGYSHRSPIGILMNGKTLKKGTKEQCERYCRKCNITIEEI